MKGRCEFPDPANGEALGGCYSWSSVGILVRDAGNQQHDPDPQRSLIETGEFTQILQRLDG